MKRETFIAILSAALAEADRPLLMEASNLVEGRYRMLRQEEVLAWSAGDPIIYLAKDGVTEKRGVIDHLNRYSVTVMHPHPTEGKVPEVVGVERILGFDGSKL